MSNYKVTGIKDAAVLTSGATTDIPFGNTLTIAQEFETIAFEGDGDTEEVYYNQRLTGTIGGDKWAEAVLEKLYGKTSVTGVSGESKSYYMGEDAELTPAQVGLRVDLAAIDDATELAATLRLTVFRAKARPFSPPDAGNSAKWAPIMFEWAAEKTSTDINGVALVGVPTGGAMYRIGVLS